MLDIQIIDDFVIYDNPKPALVSRHGFFPGISQLPSGELICLFVMGEAFESVDQTTYVSRSRDNGKTWQLEGPLYDESKLNNLTSDCAKPTVLQDGRLIAMGYRFDRTNPDHDLVNSETDGLRGGDVVIAFSEDEGQTWSEPKPVELSRPDLLEISGPCIQLQNGDIIAGGPAFPSWEKGLTTCGRGGVLLRSADGGETWDDKTFYYRSPDDWVSPYETRFTQLGDGRVIAIVWAMDHKAGKSMPNQIVVSSDRGLTWSKSIDTGILGQASNIVGWDDNTLLSIHSHREGDDAGLYVRVLKLNENEVKILAEQKIWGNAKTKKISSFQDMSTLLRFGQPSLTILQNGDILAVFWSVEDGQGRIKGKRFRVENRDSASPFRRFS